MPFKTPKGDIRWWSYLWLLCGLVLVVYGPIKNDFILAVMGVIAIVIVALIWLDQKWIAPWLMASYGIGAILRLVSLILKGFTLGGLAKVITPLYFAYVMWQWYRSEDPEEALLDRYAPGAAPPPRPNRTDPFANTASSFEQPSSNNHSSNPYLDKRSDER